MAKWSEAQVLAMHREYLNGDSLATIGAREGVTREAIRQQFLKHGLARRTVGARSSREREARERQAETHRERIIELYKQCGTIEDVLRQVDVSRTLVAAIVAAIPNREAYRRRGRYYSYPREELITALQRAADFSGEPLTIPGYRRAAQVLGLPSYDTHIRHFYLEEPDAPWAAALEAAGIQSNAPRGRRANATNLAQCVAAVARCIQGNGGYRVSFDAYTEWAREDEDAPSGATVRSVVPWSTAVELALDSLPSV